MSEQQVSVKRADGVFATVSAQVSIAVGVLYVLGNWAQNIAVIGWISRACTLYVQIWRELWLDFFAWARNWVRIDLLDYQLDLLTLIATIIIIAGIIPLIVSGVLKSIRKTTALQEAPETDVSEAQIRDDGLTFFQWLLVALSILLITFPFIHSYSLALSASNDFANELQAKYAGVSQTRNLTWFETAIVTDFGIPHEIGSFLNYWAPPIATLSALLIVWFNKKAGLGATLFGELFSTVILATAIWYFGFLGDPQTVVFFTNIFLSMMLGSVLGIALRYSPRSFIPVALVSVLIMSADFAITTLGKAVNSVENPEGEVRGPKLEAMGSGGTARGTEFCI